MTKPEHALRYNSCSSRELKRFLRNRGIQIPTVKSRDLLHFYYTNALYHADRHVTFRFLDLPAELRNAIYRELLIITTFKPGEDSSAPVVVKKVWPAILAVNHQIHQEAEDLLYAESEMIVGLSLSTYAGDVGLTVNGSRVPREDRFMITRPPSWPLYLLRARHIRIVLQFFGSLGRTSMDTTFGPGRSRITQWKGLLHDLQSFLLGAKVLKDVELELRTACPIMPVAIWQDTLSPVASMGTTISFTGFTWGIEESLLQMMSGASRPDATERTA